MTTMGTAARGSRARISAALAWAVLGVALACAVAGLIAGPGYRIGWWSLGPAFQALRWAAIFGLGAAAVGLVAVLLALGTGARRPMWNALAGLVIGLVVAAPPINMMRRAHQLPSIHDVSTDTDNPPAFDAVVPLRHGARNPVEYVPATAAEQKKGYPDIAPAVLKLPPAQAFARAEQAARAMGWEIVAVDPQALRIEATDTTLMFGFKDDVVIRVRAHPDGSRVDMRSLSRVGGSDLGVNANRIRGFMRKLGAGSR